jgi:DNA-directed RNA polymerase specialized sigma24 family protein
MERMGGDANFQPTRWSLVAAVRADGSERQRAAREQLCSTYWYPLYAYVRRSGHDAEEALDLTQSFFAHLLEKNLFALAEQERGKLRTFLLSALQRFLCDEWRKGQRLKRGGGVEVLSIDEALAEGYYGQEPVDPRTPEQIYERRWALLIIERALLDLRRDYAEAGKAEIFDAFKDHLTMEGDEGSAAEAGARLGLKPGAARTAISRLRQRYRDRLLREVAATMDAQTEEEVDEEIDALFRALA